MSLAEITGVVSAEAPRVLQGQRIAMVIDQAGHRDERAVRQLDELAAAGADVKVWSIRPDVWGDEPETLARNGVTYRRLQRGPDGEPLHARTSMNAATFRFLEDWARQEVISWRPTILAHHADSTLAFGAAMADSMGLPLVSDLPDLPRERPVSEDPWFRRRRPSRYYPSRETDDLMREFYPRADQRLTVSPGIARELSLRYRVPSPEVLLNVPKSAGSDVDAAGIGDVRSAVGVSEDTPLMVFVGNVKHGLNIEAILDAVADAPDWHLALVGSLPWQLEKYGLARRIAGGLEQRVHVVERQPDHHLPTFLSTADCGVHIPRATHFNLHHCAPNKFFAMALAGIPLIVTDLPFLATEVRRLRIGRVVSRGTSRALARAMDDVRAIRPQVRALRESVSTSYAWSRQRDVLVSTYRAVSEPRVSGSRDRA